MKLVKVGNVIFDAEKIIKAENVGVKAKIVDLWFLGEREEHRREPIKLRLQDNEAAQVWAWLESQTEKVFESNES